MLTVTFIILTSAVEVTFTCIKDRNHEVPEGSLPVSARLCRMP